MKNDCIDNFMLETMEYTCSQALSNQVQKVFNTAPEYLGHEVMAPKLFDQIPLPMTDDSCFLINTNQGHKIFVNSCPHRSKKLINAKTNKKDILCTGHHFLFGAASGELIRAPEYDSCPHLKLYSLDFSSFHGMLFRMPKDYNLEQWFFDVPDNVIALMKMDNYKFCEDIDSENTIVESNWILVMDLIDDVLHIPYAHPAFNKLLNVATVRWEFFTNGFVQIIDFDRSLLFIEEGELNRKLSKPKYAIALRYVKALRKIIELKPELSEDPTLHQIYLASLFPGLIIETIPFLKIIQHTKPDTINTSRQVFEYYYNKDVPKELRTEFFEASIPIFTQLDYEDGRLSKDQQKGIEHLARFGIKDRGATHPYFETGTSYRHAWIGKKLGLTKNTL
jgi:choline monooxygenase